MSEFMLNNNDKLEMSNGCLFVNGKPFVVDMVDQALCRVKDNKLVTHSTSVGQHAYHWNPEQIIGYWA